jgi:hypothetical protein
MTNGLGAEFKGIVSPVVGRHFEGCGDLRAESCRNDTKSPLTSASFFARLHLLSLRSFSMASAIRSNHCENTSVTGRRVAV